MTQAENQLQPQAPNQRQIPPEIRCAQDYERAAAGVLPLPVHEYIAGGCGNDMTVAANRRAFAQWDIWPRLLRTVAQGHTRVQLAATTLEHPLLLAPVAHQKLAHLRAELDTARAANATGSCMVASTLSSFTLEEIAANAGPYRWFQLYLQPQRQDTLSLVRRAEAAGYQAIVLTLDANIQVASNRALAAGFRMPSDAVAANLVGHAPAANNSAAANQSRIFQAMQNAPQWRDLEWLMQQTTLPVWVKGVLHPEDARALKEAGVAGIVVSNHGGRALDGSPASLAALPMVRAVVGPDFPVLMDGGIRSGADAFKALALGANAVLIGRLQMYALAVAGALGVAHMVNLLREELEVCMALAGCPTLADITRDALVESTIHS